MTVTTTARPAARPRLHRARLPVGWSQSIVWGAVVVLVIGPLLPLLYASFRSKPYYLPGGVLTVQGYRTLFADPAFWRATQYTLQFAVETTVLAVAAGSAFAILCGRTNMPGRKMYSTLLLTPIVIPPLGLIVGWVSIYGQSGYLTGLVGRNLHFPVWNLSSIPGMALLGAAVTIPIAFLTCQAALAGTDSSLEDAARSAGASPVQVIRHITLPLLRPALLNCTVLIFALSLEVLGIPLFLGPPAHIEFYASYLYSAWSGSITPDPSYVSAGAVLLLLVVSVLLLLRSRLLGAEQRFIAAGARGGGAYQPLDLRGWRRPLSLLVGVFIAVTSAIPLLGLVLMSGVKALTTLVAPWHLLTGSNWHQVLTDVTFRRSITNSLLIALLGGAITVGFVAVATLVAHRSGFPLRRTIAPMLVYPRAVPGIILGIGFFWSYLMVSPPGAQVRNNIWGELIALSVRNITLAYVVIYPSLARINDEFDRAARASGAGWWTISRRILLPVLRPSLLAAFLLMFVTLLNDYDPVVFLQKPGTEVIGVTMLQYWQQGVVGPVAALAVVQVLIVAVVLAIGSRAIRSIRHA
ncbi:MAG: rane protein [Streptosporangiaceae bacterium]|nr:rane protein [Streptosporangiaceae bacterium]